MNRHSYPQSSSTVWADCCQHFLVELVLFFIWYFTNFTAQCLRNRFHVQRKVSYTSFKIIQLYDRFIIGRWNTNCWCRLRNICLCMWRGNMQPVWNDEGRTNFIYVSRKVTVSVPSDFSPPRKSMLLGLLCCWRLSMCNFGNMQESYQPSTL